MDFDDASDSAPTQTLELKESDWVPVEGSDPTEVRAIPLLKFVKFQNVSFCFSEYILIFGYV